MAALIDWKPKVANLTVEQVNELGKAHRRADTVSIHGEIRGLQSSQARLLDTIDGGHDSVYQLE